MAAHTIPGRKSRFSLLLCSFLCFAVGPNVVGQISITGNQTYSENFDSMGASGTAYPTGWTGADTDATPGSNTLIVGTGSGTGGGLYNFGSASNSERALGSLASGSFIPAYGAAFTNSTGTTLAAANVQIAFKKEQWRSGSSNSINENMVFEWKLGGTFTDSGTWTAASTFDIAEILTTTTTAAAVDGNGSGNNSTLALTTFTGLAGWANGQTLYIRWRDSDVTGSDCALAVDDFQMVVSGVVATPEFYWDANDTIAGAGATPTGTWGTNAFWTSTADGTGTPVAWTAGNDAVFSAGTDAVASFDVTLNGIQSAGGVKFEEGTVSLVSGTLLLSDATPTITVSTSSALISSVVDGVNGLSKLGVGTLTLSGVNTFSGTAAISAGTLSIAADTALGNVANDLTLSGTLKTTASFDLPATREFLSGSGSLAPATGTTLGVLGNVTLSGLGIIDTGTVSLQGTTRSVGALSFTAAGTLNATGTVAATGLTATSVTSGTATINPALDLGTGTTATTVDVGSGGTLKLASAVSKGTTTTGRISKTGSGTLRLEGANTALFGIQFGIAGAAPTNGGTLEITNKEALGTLGTTVSQLQFNYGTLSATTALTGVNAIPNGISFGSRDASSAVFSGSDMEFGGVVTVFGTTSGTSGDIRFNVNNHTTFTNSVTAATNTTFVTGLAVGGSGKLTLSGSLVALTTNLKVKDTVTVEVNSSVLGAASVTTAPVATLDAGTKLAVGTIGTTTSVTAYSGLSGVATSVLHFDIGGTTAGTGYDKLILAKPTAVAAGAVTFAGKIDVDVINSFVFAAGQTFDLLDWDATVTPDFTGIDFTLLPVPGPGRAWDTSQFTTDGTLSIVSTGVDFSITTQPQSQTVNPGAEVTFSIVVSGSNLTYQWRKGLTNIDGATNASYVIPAAVEGDEGSYFVDVTNESGTLASAAAVLTVNDPVMITGEPAPMTTVDQGTPFTLTVTATGTGLTYQWRKGLTNIDGATASSYTNNNPTVADSGTYSVVVTGTVNAATSANAVVTVNPTPISISTSPSSQSVYSTYPVTFTVVAAGTDPAYQWRKGGQNIDGATGASYTINSTTAGDQGTYDVVVTGPGIGNSQTSDPATLTVTVITPGTSITGNQTYFQDFNSMGTGTPTYPDSWTGYKAGGNNSPVPGTVITSATSPAFTTGVGDSNTGRIYNFGSLSSPDRALGALAGGTFQGAVGVSFTNDTSVELVGAQIKIGFRGELWRSGSASGTDTYVFEWKIGGNINDLEGWTQASVFDITELNPALTDNVAKDGNANGNFVTLPLTTFATMSGWESGTVLHLRWRDVDNAGSDSAMAVDDFVFEVSQVSPPAPVVYWDTDGGTLGAGGLAPSGVWGTDAFWGSDPLGEVATSAWTAGSDAVFSAGADATGLFTVTVDGTQSVGALKFEEGAVTLSGGTIEFSDFIPTLTVDAAQATIGSVIDGGSGLLKKGAGTLVLAGSNLFVGNVTVASGAISIASDDALGAVANDLVFNGALITTASLDLNAGRSLSGNVRLAPATGTTLGILGSLGATSLTVSDVGSVTLTAPATLGNLTLTAASDLTAPGFTAGEILASFVGDGATLTGPVNLGATNRNLTVSEASSTLTLADPVTLTGGGTNRLIKLGAGTLVLSGANVALNKVALGAQGTPGQTGGKIIIGNKDALGITQMFFNYGTVEASADLTGANALPVGLSIGGRDGAEVVLTGQPMAFAGASALFASGTNGEIVLTVDNETTLSGALTAAATPLTGATITGFTVGGVGTLSLSGDMTGFLTSIRPRDTLQLELDTAVIGAGTITSTTVLMSLDAGDESSVVIGLPGTTRGVTAYAGLNVANTAELVFDIGGTNRAAGVDGYDALILAKANNGTVDVPGSVTFAGTVRVEVLPGFVQAAGQVFDLLDWDAAATVDFTGANYDLPALDAGLAWFTDNFTTDGTIEIVNSQVDVVANPQNQSGAPGFTAAFSVTAKGEGPLQYQWKKGTEILPGQTGRTLTIANAQLADEGSYSVVVTGAGANNVDTSDAATLTITGPVRGVIASRTGTEPAYVGDAITFSVAVAGDEPFTYQWLKDGTPIDLATNNTLVIASSVTADTGSYTVAVTSAATTIVSNAVVLTVLPIAPNIVDEPDSGMLTMGAPMTLTVVATGKPPLRYQWQKNGANIKNATTASYTDPSLALTDYGAYRCVVSNGTGAGTLSDTSAVAQIGVVSAVEKKVVLADKGSTTMTVSAAANGLSYAWKKNGSSLPADVRITGGTKMTLSITNLKATDTADYTCVLTSLAGVRTAGLHDVTVFDKAPVILKPVIFPSAVVSGQFDDPNVGGAPGFQIPYDSATDRTPTSFSVTNLPEGLKYDTKTGFISGKPLATKVGGFSVIIKAINSRGTDTTTATLNVAAFPAQTAGEYDGMVERSATMNTSMGGRIDLTISPTGMFSGSLTLGSQPTYPLTGALDVDVNGVLPSAGIITITKNSAKKAVTPAIVIAFTVNPMTNRLSGGTITQGANSVPFTAWRNVWVESTNLALNNPATAYAGLYNLGLEYVTQPAPGSTTEPLGTGYVTFKAPKSKALTVTGKTADNEVISCSTFVGPEGEVLLFRSLYTTTIRGSLLGTLKILTGTLPTDPNDNVIDDTAVLTWNRPPNTALAARTYAAGFGPLELKAVGGVYLPPVAPKVLFDRDPGATAQITFAEAGLSTATRNPNITVTIGAASKVTYPLAASNPAKTAFSSLSATTGVFAGTFELSDPNPRSAPNNTPLTVVRSKVPFFGIVVREASGLSGIGSFLLPQLPSDALNTKTTTSPILSGQVQITP